MQEVDSRNQGSRKTFFSRFVHHLSKRESIGTTISLLVHLIVLLLLALLVFQIPQLPQGILSGGSIFSSGELENMEGDRGKTIGLVNETPEMEEQVSNELDLNLKESETTESTESKESQETTESAELRQSTERDQTSELTESSTESSVHQSEEGAIVDATNRSQEMLGNDRSPMKDEQEEEERRKQSRGESAATFLERGGGFEGRTQENRGRRGGPGDPTNESEEAVEKGLRWIVLHQNREDGGWSFRHQYRNEITQKEFACPCENSGTHSSRTAATALALLPFLGAGYTQLEGPYQQVVQRGLQFLIDPKNAIPLSTGFNFQQGKQGMYSQALTTLALCEVYGMTREKAKTANQRELIERVGQAAQEGVRYIEFAQSQLGDFPGGWRYKQGETPGDISSTGWQMLALKSAVLAGLTVKSTTLTRVADFLDSTQYTSTEHNQEFPRFNYLPIRFPYETTLDSRESVGRYPDSEFTCTSIGLLLRMYLGWKPGFISLDQGISLLDRWGPFKTWTRQSAQEHCNLYYAYYATLALHHYNGSTWNRWFPRLRDFLIQTQSTQMGHEGGSWFFNDPYCNVGGRLLNTALAIMILEIRYRYLPLYNGTAESE
ncbi:MAG: prenyltransferase/squalene oxidase repeat-containing protein [Thermoguttaceae bacterium]